mmetsp:Transcript_20649/g.28054  ORF Transcript_20649/g.28054 Transcript_20649/m.28054 type:complete len:399 (-) Transcript_20649:203-1399(-)
MKLSGILLLRQLWPLGLFFEDSIALTAVFSSRHQSLPTAWRGSRRWSGAFKGRSSFFERVLTQRHADPLESSDLSSDVIIPTNSSDAWARYNTFMASQEMLSLTKSYENVVLTWTENSSNDPDEVELMKAMRGVLTEEEDGSLIDDAFQQMKVSMEQRKGKLVAFYVDNTWSSFLAADQGRYEIFPDSSSAINRAAVYESLDAISKRYLKLVQVCLDEKDSGANRADNFIANSFYWVLENVNEIAKDENGNGWTTDYIQLFNEKEEIRSHMDLNKLNDKEVEQLWYAARMFEVLSESFLAAPLVNMGKLAFQFFKNDEELAVGTENDEVYVAALNKLCNDLVKGIFFTSIGVVLQLSFLVWAVSALFTDGIPALQNLFTGGGDPYDKATEQLLRSWRF